MIVAMVIYGVVGLLAGFMAGLLGIGGGIIIVPGLLFGFTVLGLSEDFSLHTALGTSLASIVFISVASIKAHHERGYVRWDIFKRILLGVLLGTFVGAQLVRYMPAKLLQGILILFLFTIALQMLLDLQPKATRQLPAFPGLTFVGIGIGFVSSFIGVGGGSLSLPYMNACNIPTREAIGTSAAIGLPIALAGALGNIVNTMGRPELPSWSIGFIYLPALCLIVVMSMPMASLGAKIAHKLPVPTLKKIFATMLVCIATRMIYSF